MGSGDTLNKIASYYIKNKILLKRKTTCFRCGLKSLFVFLR